MSEIVEEAAKRYYELWGEKFGKFVESWDELAPNLKTLHLVQAELWEQAFKDVKRKSRVKQNE